ncbi:MAG: gliding motility-associated C-terminal domain-containing protein [Bacteroidota bacterium]|nr:gliding motility-associated C-terminal domain-containing protein [Bacteroidota bacterium]
MNNFTNFVFKTLNNSLKFILFFLFFNLSNLLAQNEYDIRTLSKFQSEYEWIDSAKLKFIFYTYRYSSISTDKNQFPDTAYCTVFYNDTARIKQIPLYKDSIFVPDYFYCLGLSLCNTSSYCHPDRFLFTIFRYTGVIDFNSPSVIDTLNHLDACNIEIGFRGSFLMQYHSNFDNNKINDTTYDNHYCFFGINRCYQWKKGDKSPKYREFQPVNDVSRLKRQGIAQIDFGSIKNNNDSIAYELTQPIFYTTKKYRPFTTGFSLNYYITSFCRFGAASCTPRPEFNPPQGFYLNPKTGISLFSNPLTDYYRKSNLFCVKVKTFKNNNQNSKVLVSEQIRLISYLTGNYEPYVRNLNCPVLVQNFPLRRYACANKRDTFTIRLRDTMAVDQVVPDTIAYQVYQNLPGGTFWESQSISNNKEIKIAWNPTLAKVIDNPYLFNINANEQRCWPNRMYEFRSCDFYVVQMPEFAIQKNIQNCGRLELKAESINPDENTYNYQWNLTHSSGLQLSASTLNSAFILPQSGKWYISLKTTNTPHGCRSTFLDSIELPFATPKISATPQNKVCQGQIITYSAHKAEVETPLQYFWQVGNQTSTDSFFSIQAIDSFKLKLSITDNRGCTATDSFEQKTFPFYNVQKLKDTAVCIGQNISVSATPNALQDSVLWLHNNSKNLTETLLTPQVYKVQYTNSNGCTAIDSFTLKNNNPIIPVKYNDQTVCKGDTVNLITFESNDIQYQSKQWRENGVLQINPNQFKKTIHQNTVLEFIATGSQYNITCTDQDTIQINLHPTNTNRLQILKTDTCLRSNEVQVSISGSTNTQSQTINWGDGAEEAYNNQTHQYSQAQTYQIKLYSTTELGCKDTQSQQVEIYSNPILEASLQQTSLCLNTNAELLISSIPNSTQHRINWGDGNIDNNETSGTKFHTYNQANNFTISIEATDNICKSDTILYITIHPLPQTTLTAENLCLGDSTIVKVQSNGNHQYTWSPQGTAVDNNTQSYKFPQIGNYEIKLQTTDLNQCQSRDSIRFSIIERPKADFIYANLSRELKYKFKFINQSTNATGYEWFFTKTNTQTSSEISPEIVFADTGIYTIILIADKNKQCFDTAQKRVPVLEQMVFYFPNVVTLKNDGINETFGLSIEQKKFAIEYQLEIFNRWGECLFKTNDTNKDWHPANIPLGVYIYQAKIRDIYNILHEVKGVVEVVR